MGRCVALSGNAGFCPHCNELLKAFEILDSNMSNDDALAYTVIQDLKPDDPIDIDVLSVSKGAAPAVLLDSGDVYVGSGAYRSLQQYFAELLGVSIWTL
jgi:hypothetical protein